MFLYCVQDNHFEADMSNNNLEVIYEGWLIKSPPTKTIWRAHWRRRWFVLRHSGELPGQYFLEYYTDPNCRRLKGKIDLDQCEQVDAGLTFENRKHKYNHVFNVKTPKRIYYLAAETEEDMNKWVEYVCHVCGLKAYKDDEEVYDYNQGRDNEETPAVQQSGNPLQGTQLEPLNSTESPPVSPTSTISGPYIPISECISGKPLYYLNGLEDFNNAVLHGMTANNQYGVNLKSRHEALKKTTVNETECTRISALRSLESSTRRRTKPQETIITSDFYDSPRKLLPPNLELHHTAGTGGGSPMQSPTTDAESVFTDDEWTAPVYPPPSVNWETFPQTDSNKNRRTNPSDSSADNELVGGDVGSWSVQQRFGRLQVVDSSIVSRSNSVAPSQVAPPRPPKPSHLIEPPGHSYLNLESIGSKASNDSQLNKLSTNSEDSKETENIPVSSSDCVSSVQDSGEEPPSPISPPHTKVIVGPASDEMYDFPRSHQYSGAVSEADCVSGKSLIASRHCYSNAAPGQVNGEVFRYDNHHVSQMVMQREGPDEPASPHSEGSSSVTSSSTAAIYSNLPSPLTNSSSAVTEIPTPPAVNRGLKPGRKLSDSTSVVSNETSPGGPFSPQTTHPPSVDRKLKPLRKYTDTTPEPAAGPFNLASPPACRTNSDGNRSLRKPRAAPSPTPPSTGSLQNGQKRFDQNTSSDEDPRNSVEEEQIYFPQKDMNFVYVVSGKKQYEIQYLDLDLESESQIPAKSGATTVYKTVDFLKTEAFKRTRQTVEAQRKQGSADQ